MTEIKFFTIVWGLFMSLYFVFGQSEPIWSTAFYSVSILMGLNNANISYNDIDRKWKKLNCLMLKILLILFVATYIVPKLDNPFLNKCVGIFFTLLIILNVYKDAKRGK